MIVSKNIPENVQTEPRFAHACVLSKRSFENAWEYAPLDQDDRKTRQISGIKIYGGKDIAIVFY